MCGCFVHAGRSGGAVAHGVTSPRYSKQIAGRAGNTFFRDQQVGIGKKFGSCYTRTGLTKGSHEVVGSSGNSFATEAPRKLLALDGGGIRGVLSLEILAEIEKKIAAKTGVDRLGDYFDYIGGTSTGAIIAAGLSIGMSAAELLDFYRERRRIRCSSKNALLQRLKSFYTDEPLKEKLQVDFRGKRRPDEAGT